MSKIEKESVLSKRKLIDPFYSEQEHVVPLAVYRFSTFPITNAAIEFS